MSEPNPNKGTNFDIVRNFETEIGSVQIERSSGEVALANAQLVDQITTIFETANPEASAFYQKNYSKDGSNPNRDQTMQGLSEPEAVLYLAVTDGQTVGYALTYRQEVLSFATYCTMGILNNGMYQEFENDLGERLDLHPHEQRPAEPGNTETMLTGINMMEILGRLIETGMELGTLKKIVSEQAGLQDNWDTFILNLGIDPELIKDIDNSSKVSDLLTNYVLNNPIDIRELFVKQMVALTEKNIGNLDRAIENLQMCGYISQSFISNKSASAFVRLEAVEKELYTSTPNPILINADKRAFAFACSNAVRIASSSNFPLIMDTQTVRDELASYGISQEIHRHIAEVHVMPGYQGQGIASQLVKEIVATDVSEEDTVVLGTRSTTEGIKAIAKKLQLNAVSSLSIPIHPDLYEKVDKIAKDNGGEVLQLTFKGNGSEVIKMVNNL
jgi:ribosomal protein S18 acetylase RimI-like enzyme